MASELEQLVSDIRRSTSQISVNKIDEIKVMRSMLNDPDFTIGVYDKSQGYIGQKCPHNEAVKFVKNVVAGATGLDYRDAEVLANQYEFTKRDAIFMLDNMRDFLYVYTGTGRKINLIQSATTEASVFLREVNSGNKLIPDKDNPGNTKTITTNSFNKLVCNSKSPRYNTGD